MSDYRAIKLVTESLQGLLRRHITDSREPDLSNVPIDLRSPRDIRGPNAVGSPESATNRISLWLYRVVRDGHALNHPPGRDSNGRILHPSLPLDLDYLLTPIATRPNDAQLLLGKVMQVLNDHQILSGSDLDDTLLPEAEHYRLTLEPLSHEELTRVWDALKEPYQLSVSYRLQVVKIDSEPSK